MLEYWSSLQQNTYNDIFLSVRAFKMNMSTWDIEVLELMEQFSFRRMFVIYFSNPMITKKEIESYLALNCNHAQLIYGHPIINLISP